MDKKRFIILTKLQTMKKIILILLLSGIQFLSFAQDVIFTKNGKQINSVILDVTPNQIKYKIFEDKEGQVYIIQKNEVSKIVYQNGTADDFSNQEKHQQEKQGEPLSYRNGFWGLTILQGEKKLSTKDIKALYKDNAEALGKFKTGKTLNAIGTIIGIPGGFIFGYQLGTQMAGGKINTTLLAVGAAGFIASIYLTSTGNRSIKESIHIFNSGINKSNSASLDFGLTNNGVGFCLRF